MRNCAILLAIGTVVSLSSATRLNAQTPSPTRYEVAGVVIDEDKAPVFGAEVALMRKGEPARIAHTGTDGRFSFSNVSPGSLALAIRRMGFKSTSVDLEMSSTGVADTVQVALEGVDTDADIVEASKGHLREFYLHKSTNKFGKFFDEKDIQRLARNYVSEVFRTVPGATLEASERTGNRVLLRGCRPIVWVDGQRAVGADIDEVAKPSDLAGMEVYPSWAGMPAQYQDRDNRMCGIVVLWTRGD